MWPELERAVTARRAQEAERQLKEKQAREVEAQRERLLKEAERREQARIKQMADKIEGKYGGTVRDLLGRIAQKTWGEEQFKIKTQILEGGGGIDYTAEHPKGHTRRELFQIGVNPEGAFNVLSAGRQAETAETVEELKSALVRAFKAGPFSVSDYQVQSDGNRT